MKKSVPLIALVFGLTLPIAVAQSFDGASIDALMQQQIKQFDVPGVGLAIVKDSKIIYSKGYGVRDTKTNTPVTAETLFQIGSSTKSFTSLAIMQLVESGKLKLDTPINTYLPNLKFSDPEKAKKVTLRGLLSHSSGLPRADSIWASDPNVKTRAQMLATVEKIPFTAEVGKLWQYCNQNFVIAGAALEQATGINWEAYTKAKIFAPLGMNRSVFEFSDAVKAGDYATGNGAGASGVKAVAPFDRMEIAGPAGSIHSSANEMAKYLAFQLSNGSLAGKNLITQASLDTMHRQEIAISNSGNDPGEAFVGYGMGWFTAEYRGVKIVQHGGNINGYTSEMQLIPEKGIGFVILTNLDGANDFTSAVRRGLTEQLLNLQPRSDLSNSGYSRTKKLLEQTKTYKPKLEDLQKLEGKYALVTGDTFKVKLEKEQLFGEQGGQRFPLLPASSTEFVVDLGVAVLSLEFKPDPSGTVWLYQDNAVVGVRLPNPASATTTELKDTKGQYSLILPTGVSIVQTTPNFIVAQSDSPQATFVFLAGAAKATLEQSVQTLVQQLDPSFNLKPVQVTALPAVNGVVWTQYLYILPNNQTLAVLVTQRGNNVYAVAVQALTNEINAAVPLLQQIISSYKILP